MPHRTLKGAKAPSTKLLTNLSADLLRSFIELPFPSQALAIIQVTLLGDHLVSCHGVRDKGPRSKFRRYPTRCNCASPGYPDARDANTHATQSRCASSTHMFLAALKIGPTTNGSSKL
jgi:hypothetical protein